MGGLVHILYAVLIGPFVTMAEQPQFLLEVLIGGLLAGVMYSLVALGFVLIYKASRVFNYAQGTMVLFAALTFVGLIERGMPGWLSLIAVVIVMIILAFAVERVVLRPLVNQSEIILFMSTLGISYFLVGFGQILWGGDVHPLDIGIPSGPLTVHGILINRLDLYAAIVAGTLVAVLALFFQKTRLGRALRAVADDHQAAMSVGIPLQRIWVLIWAIAGLVALAAGIMWGASLGVQFSLALVALKALPVLILGGFTSIPGAIAGGLIVGAAEKLGEVFWGPVIGSGVEDWFAYILALIFLLFRPQGLFGERIIARV
ncbi:MAG: branched-chain amino acid ABC transporter permease [Acetobacteraceae bacterium]